MPCPWADRLCGKPAPIHIINLDHKSTKDTTPAFFFIISFVPLRLKLIFLLAVNLGKLA